MAQLFKLSASLPGHDDDVRGVSFPNPSTIVSASRDASVRVWSLKNKSPPVFEQSIISQASSFINAVAFVPPSPDHPEGLVVSGSRDGLVEVRSPNKQPEDSADALLIGHANNVCALDVSQDGSVIVSGSWDTTARIWQVGKWSTEDSAVLNGHEASVWAVLAFTSDIIITGCADKYIRLFDRKGKLLKRFQGSDDVVRALVKLPSSQNSPAQFASAGNDSKIRLWTLEGVLVAELYGHENFIYSLAVLPTGEIVSSSEDRTVRIWRNTQCVQTITHPAISVWSVAVCHQNGDIVTGASDKVVRAFSRSPERAADEKSQEQFEESMQASAIPQQSLGDINRTDMPGPEFLQRKSGTKEGQVQLIKEANGNVSAYQWSIQGNTWLNVGTVVDATGTGNKVSYNGKDYDYVFDVDIEDGKPALKLPYNANENPYEAARKFIEDNKLPMTYLDEVTNFITKNSQGTAIGSQTQSQGQGSDPWGTESRYRPGEVNQPASTPSVSAQNILPQKQYLAISTGNHQMILKKIKEFNQQLLSDGRKELVLNENDLNILGTTIKKLEPMASKQEASISIDAASINATIRAATEWPMDKRLPWLDLLRLMTAASSDPVTHTSTNGDDLVSRLDSSGAFSKETPENCVMLAIRTLDNLFCSPAGRSLADVKFDEILGLIEPHVRTSNKNLSIALTTLYINYAVLFSSSKAADATPDPDRALGLLAALMEVLKTTSDAEALYRALVAAGTVLCLGKDFADVAKEGLDIEEAIERAQTIGKEERIKKIVIEIREHFSS